MKYIEMCAGIGGTLLGLKSAGWDCVYSNDIDQDAVEVYRSFDATARCEDLRALSGEELPPCDVLVSGFPCQPFSSSGPRLGFAHSSGSVFDNLARLLAEMNTPLALLENVRGLLAHDKGNTFLVVLKTLVALGFSVQWFLVDLKAFGTPQSRPRLVLLAFKASKFRVSEQTYIDSLSHSFDVDFTSIQRYPSVSEMTRSSITKFTSFGIADRQQLVMFKASPHVPAIPPGAMGSLVAPNFYAPAAVSSVRFYARGKGTTPLFRNNGVAHCIGNVPGSAPLYAVKLGDLRNEGDRLDFIDGSNWTREQDGNLIVRLRPERALRLFGDKALPLADALSQSSATLSKKYLLVANLFAPSCARFAADQMTLQVSRQ